jgi:phage shock protein E
MTNATILLLVGVLASGCSKSEPTSEPAKTVQPPVANVDPQAKPKSNQDPTAARALIASGATTLDVRTTEEFADGHVATAINMPVEEFSTHLAEVDKLVAGDHSRPVVVYCASGMRAAKAKTELEAAGYSHVVNGGGYDSLR